MYFELQLRVEYIQSKAHLYVTKDQLDDRNKCIFNSLEIKNIMQI